MSRRLRHPKSLVPDWHLWTDVTRSVNPLRPQRHGAEDKLQPEEAKVPPIRPETIAPAGKSHVKTPTRTFQPVLPHPEKRLEPRMRRRVMRGQLPIDGVIDLHGMRQEEAQAALTRFVVARQARGDRMLLVITGKGIKKAEPGTIFERGVLRHMLPRWLREPGLAPLIAGWEVSAQAHDGEGAYYVRLKKGQA